MFWQTHLLPNYHDGKAAQLFIFSYQSSFGFWMITVESWDSLGHKSIVLFSWLSFCARTTLILYFHHWTVPQKWFSSRKFFLLQQILQFWVWRDVHGNEDTVDFHLLFSFSASTSSSQATLWLFLNDIHSLYGYWYESDCGHDYDNYMRRQRECQRQKQSQSNQMRKLSLDNGIKNSLDMMIGEMNQFFFGDGLGCFWARQLEITLMISTSVPTLTGRCGIRFMTMMMVMIMIMIVMAMMKRGRSTVATLRSTNDPLKKFLNHDPSSENRSDQDLN